MPIKYLVLAFDPEAHRLKTKQTMLTVTDAENRRFAYHALYNYEHRFVFFTIPKVASSRWIQLFLRLEGVDDWLADPHYREERPFLSKLPVAESMRILNDPDWCKAVFFRDPPERMLSAYLDKLVYHKSYQVKLFENRNDIGFEEFLDFVLDANTDPDNPRGLHPGSNPHWRPQSMVANIAKVLEVFDFIGDFHQLANHSRILLERLGLWREFGASGWSKDGPCALFERNQAEHRTDARRKLDGYFSPGQLLRARYGYREDYALFARIRPEQRPDDTAPRYNMTG